VRVRSTATGGRAGVRSAAVVQQVADGNREARQQRRAERVLRAELERDVEGRATRLGAPEDEPLVGTRVDEPQLRVAVALVGGLLRADVIAPRRGGADLHRERRDRRRPLVASPRRAAFRVPQQVGREDVALVDQYIERQHHRADAGRGRRPRMDGDEQLAQHDLVGRGRAMHDDLTLDELAAHGLVGVREVLLRRHALDRDHAMHRTGLHSDGPLPSIARGDLNFAPPHPPGAPRTAAARRSVGAATPPRSRPRAGRRLSSSAPT